MAMAGVFVLFSFALCGFLPDAAFGVEVDCSRFPNTTNEEGKVEMLCKEDPRPVCGTDGVTYSHECLLCAYNIQYGTNISKEHDGECREAVPVDCSRYPNTTSEGGKVMISCDRAYNPVCGTDGATYDSQCQLCAHNVEQGTSVGKKHDGGCRKELAPVSVDCSENPNTDCTLEYRPLCGSDNKTYGNKCDFCSAVVESNGTLTLSHFGEC